MPVYSGKNYSNLAKPKTGQSLDQNAEASGDRLIRNSTNLAPTGMPAYNAAPSAALAGAASRRQEDQAFKDSTLVDKDGDVKLGTPKVYDSVGEAGSGFVNLSHLLGLNKASGQNSAKDLANKVKASGESAAAGIQRGEDKFTEAAKAGMGWNKELFDPGASDAQSRIEDAKNAKYTGPNDMSSMSGYSDLAKKVSDAQESAKNTQSGYGMAAEVNKQTGLSPIQSAASAFYMGVNNPNVKKAGGMFTNLQQALAKANERSMQSAQWAKGEASRFQANADPWQKEYDDFNDPRNRALTGAEKVANAEQEGRNRQDAMTDNHRASGEVEVRAVDDVEWSIKMGMPSELAYMGVSYDQWVAAGKPSYDEWLRKSGY